MLARLMRSEPVYLFFRSPAAMLSAVVAVAIIGGAIFTPFLARTNPYDLSTFSLMDGLLPPLWVGGDPRFLLGTDDQGRDMVSARRTCVRSVLPRPTRYAASGYQ